jgi:hypothetical protein
LRGFILPEHHITACVETVHVVRVGHFEQQETKAVHASV